ncbi:MAG TPA: protein translocase subunit SecD [Streptosporangiaceae bacterium]|nr:protein translocase subunit SecD [Streptosporangiaceae bacterium]
MAPPKSNVPRPGRTLAVLAALVVVLLIAIVGKDAFSPGQWHKGFKVKLGLDLSSGTTVTLQAVTVHGGKPQQPSMQKALQIIRDRVNGTGVTEAQVTQEGSDIINVAVPGVGQQKLVSLVGKTAVLRFRQVLLESSNTPAPAVTPTPTPSGTSSAPATPSPSGSSKAKSTAKVSPSPTSSSHALGGFDRGAAATAGSGGTALDHGAARLTAATSPAPTPAASGAAAAATPTPSPAASSSSSAAPQGESTAGIDPKVLALFYKLDCSKPNWQQQVGYNPNAEDNPNSQIVSCSQDGATKYLLDVAKVEGSDIHDASAGLPTSGTSVGSQWQVNFTFNSAGGAKFYTLTSQMNSQYGNNGNPTSVRDQFAIVLDGVVISAPNVDQGAIPCCSSQITGNFTQQNATDLANVLKYGALPLKFNTQAVNTVTPTLARSQLDGGLIAAAIGFVLVIGYLLLYYRGLGLVAISSLLISALLTYLSVLTLGRYMGFALSLAGIAGLIVAIGITADSFVVFFERLRDEVRDGNTLRTAVERGWKRARRTILVSDTVSFLAAAFLYYFAIGDVKGFAFTLGLTTIIDVVIVFLFTKPMITLLAGTRFFGGGHPLSGLDPARLGARRSWRASPRPVAQSPTGTGAGTARAATAPPNAGAPPRSGQAGSRTSPKEA